jgi:hypothetical protein
MGQVHREARLSDTWCAGQRDQPMDGYALLELLNLALASDQAGEWDWQVIRTHVTCKR